MRGRGRMTSAGIVLLLATTYLQALPPAQHSQGPEIVFAVSASGSDTAPGTPDAPFLTLERAQLAVRAVNADHNVAVELGNGIYRLTRPLIFTAEDGGRDGRRVIWRAVEGAHPVLSGAT